MELNKLFDHTNLNPDATFLDIIKLCNEAKKYDFMSVCVNPFYVKVAKRLLKETNVKVCTVVGFPLGASNPLAVVNEAKIAVNDGADEVDMVQNISMAKEHDYEFNEKAIKLVKEAIGDKVLKVILENCYLNEEEIKQSCLAAVRGGADFVKTSTGFGKGGATVSDVKLMRETVGDKIGVKAAGGIHSKEEVLALIEAGANRIGCSRSVAIMEEK